MCVQILISLYKKCERTSRAFKLVVYESKGVGGDRKSFILSTFNANHAYSIGQHKLGHLSYLQFIWGQLIKSQKRGSYIFFGHQIEMGAKISPIWQIRAVSSWSVSMKNHFVSVLLFPWQAAAVRFSLDFSERWSPALIQSDSCRVFNSFLGPLKRPSIDRSNQFIEVFGKKISLSWKSFRSLGGTIL